jgi:arabinofuranosyltransferase
LGGTGVSRWDYAQQGLFYLQNALITDPITFLTITAALFFAFIMWKYKNIPPAAGILFSIFYVVYVGGDFMAGRFLVAPLFLSVIILSRIEIKAVSNNILLILIIIIIIIGLLVPGNPVITDSNYTMISNIDNNHGIADERGYYYHGTGLLNSYRFEEMPEFNLATEGRELRKINNRTVQVAGSIGFMGYFAGPKHHFIDYLGLADPLLARLPTVNTEIWRIGHFARSIPDGYIQSIENDSNLITDPNISKYYEILRLITSGPLFDPARLRAIWDINTGSIAFVESFDFETNTDRPGMDYSTFDLADANPGLCEQACDEDPNCMAFTYVKTGVQGTCAKCYLKSGIPAAYPATCCDSGARL